MTAMTEQAEKVKSKDGLKLELTRFFDATPERVFDAWVNENWGEWLPPFGATGRVTVMDVVVGGEYAVTMHMEDGREIEMRGRYVEIDRPHKLVMTWTGNYDGNETLITVLVRAEGSGTYMTLRQEGFVQEQMQQGYTKGWSGEGGCFDKLAVRLAKGL